jgi:hypothetical protein
VHGEGDEGVFSYALSLVVFRLSGEFGEKGNAVVGLNAGEPGEGDASCVEPAACVGGTHFDDGSVIETYENVHVGGGGLLVAGVHAVSRGLELIFTAASIFRL